MLHLSADLLEEIGRRGLVAYPEECCGILLGRITPGRGGATIVEHALAADNIADAPTRATRYTVAPAAILHADHFARANGLEIVGFYHTHPDHPACPSRTDTALGWEYYVYLIISVSAQSVVEQRAWRFPPPPGEDPREEPLTITDHVP